ncbi:MAG: leucine-rich repeat domain-containing protein [Bradymonadaceae bacterium]
MTDIHVTYQWVKSSKGGSTELVRREAVLDGIGGENRGDFLDHIEELKNLDVRQLRMEDNRLIDLEPIAQIANLEVLRIAGNEIVDVSPLARLTHLQILDLGRNANLSSVAPLAGLHELEELNIFRTRVGDLEPIATLPALKKLNISDTLITDLAPLTEMPALREIQIFGFGEVERGTDDWNILVDLLTRGVRVDAHGVGKMITAASQLRDQRKNLDS